MKKKGKLFQNRRESAEWQLPGTGGNQSEQPAGGCSCLNLTPEPGPDPGPASLSCVSFLRPTSEQNRRPRALRQTLHQTSTQKTRSVPPPDIAMTTEYHDDPEEDSTFWTKETSASPFRPFRVRRWMFPALTAAVILVLIIALGASNAGTSNRLWLMEKVVSNLTESLSSSQQLSREAAKDVHRLKFAVESNKDQLSSVAEALKDLSTLDSLSRTVAYLKCSLERIINNGSTSDGCCPLNWDFFAKSCYFFSTQALTWEEARDWCNGHESHLVILANDKEWDFVTGLAAGTFHWVGLTDERTGKWEWVNQTPYVMDRRRWHPGQPDSWTGHGMGHGDEDCAHLNNDGRLNDLHCLSRLRYICQRHSQRS